MDKEDKLLNKIKNNLPIDAEDAKKEIDKLEISDEGVLYKKFSMRLRGKYET